MSQRKKKRPSGMFNLENIDAKLKWNASYLRDVRAHIKAISELDLERIMPDMCEVTEDEALIITASKISAQGLFNLKETLRHVPANITRVVDGTSLRFSLVLKIFNAMASPGIPKLSIEDLQLFSRFLGNYCPTFMSVKETTSNFWNLSRDEDLFFNKFLTPPVSSCIRCDRQLTMHNNPTKANMFTLEGPIPCSKISLECRSCSVRYGISNCSDDSGTHFYPSEYGIDIVEVSNITYMNLKLYRWIPSLR